MYKRPLHHKLFLELIRSALWNRVSDLNLFRNIDESVWFKVMNTAQKQALLGVCYPALSRLPSDCRPPQNIYLVWAAKANYIRQENKKKLQVLSELLSLFKENGIYPVVMKGFSSAILYPEPDLRICGDIDLFIPDNYEESLKLVSDLGYEMSETEKHHKFYYKEVLIELHHHIISSPFKNLKQYKILEVEYAGIKFKTFDETTTAILLLTHSVIHLIGPGLGFRHVCDWIIFLYNNCYNIDKTFLNKYIKENRLVYFVNIFNELANRQILDDDFVYAGIIKKNINFKDVFFLEKDLFLQGDCGYKELMYRKEKYSLYVYLRVLIRCFKYLRYGYFVICRMLLLKFYRK